MPARDKHIRKTRAFHRQTVNAILKFPDGWDSFQARSHGKDSLSARAAGRNLADNPEAVSTSKVWLALLPPESLWSLRQAHGSVGLNHD